MDINQNELDLIENATIAVMKHNHIHNYNKDDLYNDLAVWYFEYKLNHLNEEIETQKIYRNLCIFGNQILQQYMDQKYRYVPYKEIVIPVEEACFEYINNDITNKYILERAFEVLKPREISILSYRYGLTDNEEHTLKATGKKFGLTDNRIRQIEQCSFRKIKNHLRWVLNNPRLEKYKVNRLFCYFNGKDICDKTCKHYKTCKEIKIEKTK